MTTKDWILLLVPLFANLLIDGLLVFLLKLMFERKERVRKIKIEYVDKLRAMTDEALHYIAEAIKSADAHSEDNETFVNGYTKCFNLCNDIYFYIYENITNLSSLRSPIVKIKKIVEEITRRYKDLDEDRIVTLIDELHTNLINLKMACIKY